MAKPIKRAKKMQATVDEISRSISGRSNSEAIGLDVCVFCGKEATSFRDNLSMREYTISGMCQACQDDVFGK